MEHMHVCVWFVCMYVRGTHACMYVWMYVCIYAFMYVCLYMGVGVCMYVCMYVYVAVQGPSWKTDTFVCYMAFLLGGRGKQEL